MMLPYPHARNDCGACRERDADVQVLDERYDEPDERPVLLCQGCLGRYMALRAIQEGGPALDQLVVISVTVAPGRRTDTPFGLAGGGGELQRAEREGRGSEAAEACPPGNTPGGSEEAGS